MKVYKFNDNYKSPRHLGIDPADYQKDNLGSLSISKGQPRCCRSGRTKHCAIQKSAKGKCPVQGSNNTQEVGRIQKFRVNSFNFAGYTFKPRFIPTRNSLKIWTAACMSQDAKNSVRDKIRKFSIRKFRGIESLALEYPCLLDFLV